VAKDRPDWKISGNRKTLSNAKVQQLLATKKAKS
jgi:hypothetical protein